MVKIFKPFSTLLKELKVRNGLSPLSNIDSGIEIQANWIDSAVCITITKVFDQERGQQISLINRSKVFHGQSFTQRYFVYLVFCVVFDNCCIHLKADPRRTLG